MCLKFLGWFRFDLGPPFKVEEYQGVLDTYNDLYVPYYWSHLIIGISKQLTGNHVPQSFLVGSDLSFDSSLEVTFSP